MQCPFCQKELPDDARFCAYCGRQLQTVREILIPVTVLFVDLSGYTRMVREHPPEEVSRQMSVFFPIVEDEVQKVEGTLLQKMGDGALCVFGYPMVLEEAPERAAYAALEILQRLREKGMVAHGGIASGRVLVSQGKGVTLIGEPMNLAARLQELSPPGVILVDEETSRHIQYTFSLKPFPTKDIPDFGKQSVYVLQHVRRNGTTWRKISPTSEVFVGRERELRTLQETYSQFLEDPVPRVVRVLGEPGSGKTRLVMEFLRTVDAPRVLLARALPYGMPPFGPLLYALQNVPSRGPSGPLSSLVTSAPAALDDLKDQISRMKGGDSKDAVYRFSEIFRTMVQEPTLLVLEDAQWADTLTHRVIMNLLRQGFPLFLLYIARIPAVRGERWEETLLELEQAFPARVIRMNPLTLQEIARWWRHTWNQEPNTQLLRQVHKITGGNALFFEEYVRYIHEHQGKHMIPDRLESLILARVQSTDAEARTLLEIASMMGSIFPKEVLRDILGWEAKKFGKILDQLLGRELVMVKERHDQDLPDELSFRHIMLQEVLFQSIPTTRRKVYARQIFEVVRDQPHSVWHSLEMMTRLAYWAEYREWFRTYLLETLESLNAVGAWKESLEILEEFPDMDVLLAPEDIGEVQYFRAQALFHMGRYDEARSALEKAKRSAGTQISYQLLKAKILERETRYEEAYELLSRIQPPAPELDRERTEMMIWVAYRMGRYSDVEQLWAYHDRLPPDKDPSKTAYVLNLKANTLHHHEIKNRRIGMKTILYLRREVLRIAQTHHLRGMEQLAHNNLSIVESRGYVTEALHHLNTSLTLARRLQNPYGEAVSLYNLGEVFYRIGAWEKSREYLRAYLAVSRPIRYHMAFPYVRFLEGRMALDTGQYDKALRALSEASAWAYRLQSPGLRAEIHVHLASLLLAMGRPAGWKIASWSWELWKPHEKLLFRWMWGHAESPDSVQPGDILRAVPGVMSWHDWLYLLLVLIERDPSLKKKLFWKAKNIFCHVLRNVPETYQPYLLKHPRFIVFS